MAARAPASASLFGFLFLGCFATTERIEVERSPSSPDGMASESFELYRPREPAGAGIVWVSAGGSGAPPRSYAPILDRHRVIWIGANRSGNRRAPHERVRLALAAADQLRGISRPESMSVYVAGFSGGARIASEAALVYPDVFAGGMFAGAADYFRFVRSSDPRWNAWEPTFAPPPAERLVEALTRGRYVFVTGSRDSNRALVRDVYRAYLEDGFSRVGLIDIEELGHDLPPPACFDLALVELLADRPPKSAATRSVPGSLIGSCARSS